MKFLSAFAAIFILFQAFGQNSYPYGLFNIRNIDRTENKGGVQNWDIILNDDNFVYVANNSGILEFNGEQWYKFELSNQEHPRSFAKDKNGRIYVGGINEFAYIDFDEKGRPYCNKISQEVDSIEFKDIWNIFCMNSETYFISRSHAFVHDSTGIEVTECPEGDYIRRSIQIGDDILCSFNDDTKSKLRVFKNGKFIPVANSEAVPVVGSIRYADSVIIIDESGFMYNYISDGNGYSLQPRDQSLQFESSGKYRHVQSLNSYIYTSTEGTGVQVFDLNGKLIRTIEEKDGLNNAIIRGMTFDQYNNLWLATDNGVSFVEMSSPITKFGNDQGANAGVTEDILLRDGKVVLATHSDLYTSKVVNSKMSFESTPVFGFETWQIKVFDFPDGETITLIIGNDGIYSLDENMKTKVLAKYVYAWELYQSKSDPNRVYVGLDGDGLGSLYYNGNGDFKFEGKFAGTSGEVRSLIEFNDEVYYSVKYDGIHILDTTKEQSENRLNGLVEYPDSVQSHEAFTITEFRSKVYVGTVHGLYELESGKLKKSDLEDCLFCEQDLLIHRSINDGDGKLWLVMFHKSGHDDEFGEVGYVSYVEGKLRWYSSPFNQITDDVIFSIKKAENGIFWMGGVKGVYTYNENVITKFSKPFQVNIAGVYLNDEELFVYHDIYAQIDENIISYDQNSIRFEFGANAYLGSIENEYSWYLEGEEEEWSKWKSTPHAEFQRLSEGDYVFHLKARNFYGYESEETTFAFTITPPWYRTWWAYIIYLLLFIGLIYVVIQLSIRRVKAQNERLEQTVEERTKEIAKQNAKLEIQKAEIQEKTNDILDSIKYAKRIQSAILPTDETLNDTFDSDHMVLYKPKDIVSGDFYWAERFGPEAIFAAVDCTGHGVPGAFVSIVGFNGLNRTVNEFNLRKPGEILDKLTDLVVGTFSQSESQIKDGMDIALCNINYETKKLMYAGANNPLILIRNGEIIETKANKQPIGEFANRVPFTTHEVQLEVGDVVYVYSDGYADQFGGEKGKKFKGKALKELLLDISKFDMKSQRMLLNKAFEEWKGDFEQLDDVCLFGVKIE